MVLYYLCFVYWGILSVLITKESGIYFVSYRNKLEQSAKKNRKRIIFLLFIPILLIMALRGLYVGADTFQYYYRYTSSANMISNSHYQSEWGYNYIGYFFNDILGLNWQLYLVIVSLFMILVYGILVYRYSEDALLSIFIYFTIGLFTMNMSGIRQSLAVVTCLLEWMFLDHFKGRTLIKYSVAIMLNMVAYSIHNSAFFFLGILFFTGLRLSKKAAFSINAFAALMLLLRIPVVHFLMKFVPQRYTNYSVDDNYQINILVIAVTLAIPFYCLIFSKEEKDGKYSQEISMMYIFSAMNILFTMLSISNNQIGRIAYYFVSCYMILIPNVLSCQNKSDRKLSKMIIVALCLIYFIKSTYGGTLKIDNYYFFWQNAE